MRRMVGNTRWGSLPLDAVLLTLVMPATVGGLLADKVPAAVGIVVILTVLYWLLPLRLNLGRVFGIKLLIALVLIGIVVVQPTIAGIQLRHATRPWKAIHDSALQIEIATTMLLHGQDYYRATYFNTPLVHWWTTGPPNPALYHTDSLPFQEELTVPFMVAAKAALGWFDERFIYLLCLGLVVGMALALGRTAVSRLTLVIGLGLNPLLVPTIISGQNDIQVLAEVMGVLLLARAGHRRGALLLLGTALATKETALFLLPFLLLYLARRDGVVGTRATGVWLARSIGWVALPVVVFVGPFLVWDARAFLDSTIGFVEGTVPHPFPIRGLQGYGFASFVLFGHLVRSDSAYWPFGVVQALTAGPILLILLWRQWRDNRLGRAMASYATVLLLMYYFSRFFHASFIAYAFALAVLAVAIGRDEAGIERLELRTGTSLSLDVLLVLLLVPQFLPQTTTETLAIHAAVAMGLVVLYTLVAVATDGWTCGPARQHRAHNRSAHE